VTLHTDICKPCSSSGATRCWRRFERQQLSVSPSKLNLFFFLVTLLPWLLIFRL